MVRNIRPNNNYDRGPAQDPRLIYAHPIESGSNIWSHQSLIFGWSWGPYNHRCVRSEASEGPSTYPNWLWMYDHALFPTILPTMGQFRTQNPDIRTIYDEFITIYPTILLIRSMFRTIYAYISTNRNGHRSTEQLYQLLGGFPVLHTHHTHLSECITIDMPINSRIPTIMDQIKTFYQCHHVIIAASPRPDSRIFASPCTFYLCYIQDILHKIS